MSIIRRHARRRAKERRREKYEQSLRSSWEKEEQDPPHSSFQLEMTKRLLTAAIELDDAHRQGKRLDEHNDSKEIKKLANLYSSLRSGEKK